MENLILKIIELVNPVQTAIVIIAIVISYFKTKNQTNSLDSRFDRQFGDYKDKNRIEIESMKERIYKLEVELQFSKQNQAKQSENPQCP